MKTQNNIYRIISLIIILGSLVACKKDKIGILPTVITYSPKFVSSTSATIGCTVESDGDSDFICGVYMGTSENPETTGTQFQIGNQRGTFLGQITGLTPETQYYIRAYIKNSSVETLAEQISITTPAMVTDYDDNVYKTVLIGTRLWMQGNLKTTHYMNGDPIGTTIPDTLNISGEISPKYEWSYNGDAGSASIYGKLYTYYSISDTRKVCPTGWHVPTDSEWASLETAVGGFDVAGSMLKEAGNLNWIPPYNLDATNESLFSALPGGIRNQSGGFSFIGNYGYWWSSTVADDINSWVRYLSVQSTQILRIDFKKYNGASVRCIKDL